MRKDETNAERKVRKLLFAKKLRRRMTRSEEILWDALRRHGVDGLKFRRQVVIDRFIVDFICFQRRLVLEVDGPIHDRQRTYDLEREGVLKKMGFRILRFTNHEVNRNVNDVLERIRQAVSLSR